MTTTSSRTARTPTRPPKQSTEFDALWRVLPHPPGSVVRLFARGGDHREGDFARSAAEVRRFARAYADHNVYVAPNPTGSTAGARHAARDVTHWSYLLIDLDPVCSCPPDRAEKKLPKCRTCRGKADPLAACMEALSWLDFWLDWNFYVQRPVILDSGRGVQAWIRLEDLILTDEPSDIVKQFDAYDMIPMGRSVARRVNSYWLRCLDEKLGVSHGCRIDTSVSDLPRVMRCPGTINQKTKREARFIHETNRVFVGLAKRLVDLTPARLFTDPPESPEGVPAGQPWQMVFPHLTRTAQDYLLYGQCEPGRHRVMWHTARKLQELGVERVEAGRALAWGNRLKGKEEELPVEQIKHALDTAYKD